MAATRHVRGAVTPPAPGAAWVACLRRALARRRGRRVAARAARSARPLPRVAALMAGLLGAAAAGAVTLPEDRAEAMYHRYDGGGVTADGPALLVRKGIGEDFSLSGSYYVDAVSNASIDVVTTASPFKETRNAYDVGLDVVHRDAMVSLKVSRSDEPDYVADTTSVDVSQEVFGGMSTVSLGFSRGSDRVGEKGLGFFDSARHWQYRVGLTQILSPRWLASANFEIVADDGYLGNPYRVARVFGAAVPERSPRTRSSRALKLRTVGAVGSDAQRAALRAEYRYFWDNWDITAHTVEVGYARYLGSAWLVDGALRLHTQGAALFYADNATTETRYVSRNRQLSDFRSVGLALQATWTPSAAFATRYGVKLTGGYELKQFKYSDFTDLRSGEAYSHNAHLLQLTLSAKF